LSFINFVFDSFFCVCVCCPGIDHELDGIQTTVASDVQSADVTADYDSESPIDSEHKSCLEAQIDKLKLQKDTTG